MTPAKRRHSYLPVDRATTLPSRRTSSSYSGHSADSSATTQMSDVPQDNGSEHRRSSDSPLPRAKAGSVEVEDKLAQRRARNRVAAYKSRTKRSKEIAHLEEDMERERDRRAELTSYVEGLKSEVFNLKNEVLLHGQCDFPPIKQYLMSHMMKLGPGVMKLGPGVMQQRLQPVIPPLGDLGLPPMMPAMNTNL